MSDLLFLTTIVASLGLTIGLFGLVFRPLRRRARQISLVSFVVLFASMTGTTAINDNAARDAGFENAEDMRAATEAGIADPEEWRATQAAAEQAEQAAAEAEEAERRRLGFHCLDAWNGAHGDFLTEVRRRLREPDSFEHIATVVGPVDDNGMHDIAMEYRARNGFGGMNIAVALGEYRSTDCAHRIVSLE